MSDKDSNYFLGILCVSNPSCNVGTSVTTDKCTLKHPSLAFPDQRRKSGPQSFDITGQQETQKEASLLFTIHLMHLTTQDQHELQLDPIKVPSPHFKESYTFQVPVGFSIS